MLLLYRNKTIIIKILFIYSNYHNIGGEKRDKEKVKKSSLHVKDLLFIIFRSLWLWNPVLKITGKE